MNRLIHRFINQSPAGTPPDSALVFASYCLASFIYFDNLPIFGFLKKILFLKFCRLLVKSVAKKNSGAVAHDLEIELKFIRRIDKRSIFYFKSRKIQINAENSPWSTIFPGCPLYVDQELGEELAEFLSGTCSIADFWSDALIFQPGLGSFFSCSHDIIFSPSHATRVHNFYCEGSNFFSFLIKKIGTFVCDLNSFLLLHQLHVHALVISIFSAHEKNLNNPNTYLKSVNIYKTSGFGIGDLITNYPALDYYVPQVLNAHCSCRQELKSLLRSLWSNYKFEAKK